MSYTIQYRDGKQDGRWTHWHTNGKKHSEADYKDGVKHGREASWDQKGKLQYDRKFVNGEIVE